MWTTWPTLPKRTRAGSFDTDATVDFLPTKRCYETRTASHIPAWLEMKKSDDDIQRDMSEPVRGTATEAELAQITELEDFFEAKLGAELGQQSTSIRWTAGQLAVIKVASAKFGQPYAADVKGAAFRRALHDLEDSRRLGI